MEDAEVHEVGVEQAAESAHEHASAAPAHKPWVKWLALTTACFAVAAAIASLLSGRHANEALLAQARATDQWALYQAKSSKQVTRMAEVDILGALHGDRAMIAAARDDVERYAREQEEIKKEALGLEAESHASLGRHEHFAAIVTLLQVAIGFSAIAALVDSRKLWLVSSTVGTIVMLAFLWFVVRG
jgi:hypothetical protein